MTDNSALARAIGAGELLRTRLEAWPNVLQAYSRAATDDDRREVVGQLAAEVLELDRLVAVARGAVIELGTGGTEELFPHDAYAALIGLLRKPAVKP